VHSDLPARRDGTLRPKDRTAEQEERGGHDEKCRAIPSRFGPCAVELQLRKVRDLKHAQCQQEHQACAPSHRKVAVLIAKEVRQREGERAEYREPNEKNGERVQTVVALNRRHK